MKKYCPSLFKYIFIVFFSCYFNIVNSQNAFYEKIETYFDKDLHSQAEKKLDSLYFVRKGQFEISDSTLLEYYVNLGNYYYYEQDDESAEAVFGKIVQIRKILYPNNVIRIAKDYKNIGMFNSELKNFGKAIDCYHLSEKYFKQAKDSIQLSKVQASLANVYFDKGDYHLARQLLEEAIPVLKRNDLDGIVADAYLKLGEIHSELEAYPEAHQVLDQALEYYKGLEDSKGEANVYLNRGSALDAEKKFNQALERYKKAKQIHEAEKDTINLEKDYDNIGRMYRKTGNYVASLEAHQYALSLAESLGKESEIAGGFDNIGVLYLVQKKFDLALQNFQSAIKLLVPNFEKDEPSINPSTRELESVSQKVDLLDYLRDKGSAWLAYYEEKKDKEYLKNALETYQCADELIDLLRYSHIGETSKYFWREKTNSVYANAIKAAFLLEDKETVFRFFEKSKSALLLDQLRGMEAIQFANIPDSLIEKEKTLKSDLYHAETANDLLQVQKDYQAFITVLENKYPQYYNLKYDAKTTSIEALQNKLDKEQAVLNYFIEGDSIVYILYLRKDKVELNQSKLPNHFLDSLVYPFVEKLKNRNSNFQKLQTEAKILRNILFPQDWIYPEKISIIPDGDLYLLPFETLIKEESRDHIPHYLIYDHNISYNYSVKSLLQKSNHRNSTREEVLMFAPTDFYANRHTSLSFSNNLYQAIKENYTVKPYMNADASGKNFIENAHNGRILQLTTHAKADPPQIYFYKDTLNLTDIYTLNTQAKLAILSACETGTGKLKIGEGMISLARAFAYAGVPSTITSLWSVNEKSTSEIIASFYKNLDNDDINSEALRQAKITYIQDVNQMQNQHPYYWSALIFIGRDELGAKKYKPILWLALGFCFIVFSLFFILKKNR